MKKNIIVMGANPAWQKTLLFAGLHRNKVNRAHRMETYPAGKGVNFCRAVACFGKAETMLLQFAGGANGSRLCNALDTEGIRHETVETEAETRCCITCLDSTDGGMTELIEPSGRVTTDEAEEFLARIKTHIGRASLFAITGSLPDGTDLSLCKKAAEIAVSAGVPVLADAVKGIAPVLELSGKVYLKVNREEFFALTGCTEIRAAHHCAANRWHNASFAVTDGAGNATFSDGSRLLCYALPEIAAVNPLGAGDTASAVFASALLTGQAPAEAFRSALAAASANCLSERAGEFRMEDFNTLLPQIQITEQHLND